MVGYNLDGPARDRVMKLIEEKDRIESEIREQTSVLETNNVGMHDTLVDDQGFPRNDIDVYKVRHARHAIICLQNDHKAIMKRIEQGLEEVHSQILPPQGQASQNPTTSVTTNGHVCDGDHNSDIEMVSDSEHNTGFATITFVHNGSPADLAGLCEHDEVLQFGSVSSSNFTDITQVHDIVAHSVGQNIRVVVKRNRHTLNLTVTPRPWAQPGLLGCQIQRRISS